MSGGSKGGKGGSGSGRGDAPGVGGSSGRVSADPCDLRYDVDLTGARTGVLAALGRGSVLDVALHREGAFETAACLTRPARSIAGTLANIEGLDLLLGCLRAGHAYTAQVLAIDGARCRVLVERVRH